MKYRLLLLALLGVLLASACSPESSRPKATGKGYIRVINAAVSAPNISFLLEERRLDSVPFKAITTSNPFDDLEYSVNFDYRFVNDVDATRLVSVPFKLNANNDHLFVFTGTLSAPSAFLRERPRRDWAGTETTMEIEIAHLSPQLGAVDVYFAPPGTAPALGNALATVSNGNITAPVEIEAATFVVTVTSPDNPADVLFESSGLGYAAAGSYIVALFDGDPSIPSPFSINVLTENGSSQELENVLAPQTLRLFHASADTVATDVYRGGDFTAPVISNTAFGSASPAVPSPAATTGYTFTEAGNVGNIVLEEDIAVTAGRRVTRFLVGQQANVSTVPTIDDLRPREDVARLRIFQGSLNHTTTDIYVLPAGTAVSDGFPRFFSQLFTSVTNYVELGPGSYDVYATAPGEKTVYVGPVSVNLVVGDIVQFALIDTADPAVLQLVAYDGAAAVQ